MYLFASKEHPQYVSDRITRTVAPIRHALCILKVFFTKLDVFSLEPDTGRGGTNHGWSYQLPQLYRRLDLSVRLRDRVYCAILSFALLYGWQTWSPNTEDVRRWEVYNQVFSCRIEWSHWMRNARIRNQELRIFYHIISSLVDFGGWVTGSTHGYRTVRCLTSLSWREKSHVEVKRWGGSVK